MSNAPHLAVARFWVNAVLASSCCSCAAGPFPFDGLLDHGRNFYGLYDNSRDWGPSYLVESPYHYLGDESRIDDSRSAQFHESGPQSTPLPSILPRPLPLPP